MQFIKQATWQEDVFMCWQRCAGNAQRPNSDVWGPLPEDIQWLFGRIELSDLASIHLIGSADFMATFGSYRLQEIYPCYPNNSQDRHLILANAMLKSLQKGTPLETPILIGESLQGPFLILDGNHRCLAHHANNTLTGLAVYIGLRADLFSRYIWAHHLRHHPSTPEYPGEI